MRETLIEILACPDCGGELRLQPGAVADGPNRIRSGIMECPDCAGEYPIVRGIPRLLPFGTRCANSAKGAARTAMHFAEEFSALAGEDRDIDVPDLVEYLFYSRTGIDPDLYAHSPGDFYRTSMATGPGVYRPRADFLLGKRALDAGCGPGRFIPVAACAAKQVVGLDFGAHVERAACRCAGLDNVEFIQGSVLSPPFKAGSFDYIFSLGVLHHTPDPRAACMRLARLLAANGAMSIWVYPPAYWGRPVQAAANRLAHAVLRRLDPETSMRVCARVLYPIGRIQMALDQRRWTKLLAAPLFLLSIPRHPRREVMIATIHDYYCPPIISTHSYREVEAWLQNAGFRELSRLPVPTAWLAQARQ